MDSNSPTTSPTANVVDTANNLLNNTIHQLELSTTSLLPANNELHIAVDIEPTGENVSGEVGVERSNNNNNNNNNNNRHRSDEKEDNNLLKLMMAQGTGAMTFGLGEIINPPHALTKHRVLIAAFYIAQAAQFFFGVGLLGLFLRCSNATRVERKQWHRTSKVVMIVAFIPVIVAIVIAQYATLKFRD